MTQSKVNPIPDGVHTVTPHLICAGAAKAIEFYKKAFDAEEIDRVPNPQGQLVHAAVRIGDSMVMLMDEMPDWHALGPKALTGTPVSIHLCVADVDATFKQAVEAGASEIMALEDMFWGDRYGVVEDPFGHHWSLATHIRDMTTEEVQQAAKETFAQMAESGQAGCASQ